MPEINHIKEMKAPVEKVWNFVKDQNNWAPFLMGYQSHEIINDKESVWRLKSSIAGVTYAFEMNVVITKWEEGEKVGFNLMGTTHPVKGSGTVTLLPRKKDETEVSFLLHLQGRGLATPVVNIVVAPLLKPMAEQLLDKIDRALEKVPVPHT